MLAVAYAALLLALNADLQDPEPGEGETPATSTKESREVVVTTEGFHATTELEAFRHAGARSVVTELKLRGKGATTLTQAFEQTRGVRAVQGSAGLGTVGTKLNLGVRGVNPRFSSRATVLLDEIPIATAPYGRPQLDLLPLGPFSIVAIDAARSGASVRYGPQTSGGVFNLVSRPIPVHHTVYGMTLADNYGGLTHGAAYGGTFHRKLGAYVEYSTRLGQEFRQHSRYESHGGTLKLRYQPSHRWSLLSTTHAYWEDQQIPGGLTPAIYSRDPRSSIRTGDSFTGWRVGSSARLQVRPQRNHDVSAVVFTNHTDRNSTITDGIDGEAAQVELQPRIFDVVGVEPRYTVRAWHQSGVFHDVSIGLRGVYEQANMRGHALDVTRRVLVAEEETHDRARLGAGAAFVEEKVYLADADLVLTVGFRGEVVRIERADAMTSEKRATTYGAPLPATSIWWAPVPNLAFFASYGRSFGPPQFLQLTLASSERQLRPELADTIDAGIKLNGVGGLHGEVIGWGKLFHEFIDVSLEDVMTPGATRAFGVETEARWRPGEIRGAIDGLELEIGHAYTRSDILGSEWTGNEMPFYPRHELWSSAGYWPHSGFFVGTDVRYLGEQFSDYANTVEADDTGQVGLIPETTIWSASLGGVIGLRTGSELMLSFGVRNITDTAWISRSDDRNGGIFPQQPRTFWGCLQLRHRARSPVEHQVSSRRGSASTSASE